MKKFKNFVVKIVVNSTFQKTHISDFVKKPLTDFSAQLKKGKKKPPDLKGDKSGGTDKRRSSKNHIIVTTARWTLIAHKISEIPQLSRDS